MAKNDLITGSIWDEYSNQVIRRMDDPTHQGEITEEQAKEMGGNLSLLILEQNLVEMQ